MKSFYTLAVSTVLLSSVLSPAMAQVTETTETRTMSTTGTPYNGDNTVTRTSETTTSVSYVNDYSVPRSTGDLRADIRNVRQRLKDDKEQLESAKSMGNDEEVKRLKTVMREDKMLLSRLSATSSGMDHIN